MSDVIVTDRSRSFSADWEAAEELGKYMLMSQGVRETLDDNDLEDLARVNARAILSDLLAQVGADVRIEFEFLASDEQAIDRTCEARLPLMWTYDTSESRWRRQ